jgi:DNA-binding response OmpR family regulator
VARILILEDNEDCITIYQDILSKAHELHIVSTLADLHIVRLKKDRKFDLMLADMKLPDGIFLDWAQKNPALMEDLATIIVSSLEDMDILTNCFEWGAIDYLIKPFKMNDLMVKIAKGLGHFQLKKNTSAEDELQSIQDELTAIEAKIFQQIARRPDQFVGRELIQPVVWKKVSVNPKTLDVHLSNIRKKLSHTDWFIDFEDSKGWKLSKKKG